MPNNQGKTTNVVSITVTLNSSTATAPPYYASSCTGTVTFTGNPPPPPESFDNWATEDIGTPPTGGASLNLTVVDQGYSSSNATSVAGWTLSFLPRSGTTQPSPLTSNNMSGGAVTGSNGAFALISSTSNGNNVIRAHGSSQQEWDWSLMVQMKMPDGSIKSFVSDPEMQMDN